MDSGGTGDVESRSARRAEREERRLHPVTPPMATKARPVMVAAACALSALIALSGFAGYPLVAMAVTWTALVLAWGWPELLGSSSRFGCTFAIGLTGVVVSAASAFTPDEPYLRHVPMGIVFGLIALFVHQLTRRDGRPRLTHSVSVSAGGVAVASLGSAYIATARTVDGPAVLAVLMAGIGCGAFADLLAGSDRWRGWLLWGATVLGAAGGALTALLAGPALGPAALLGGLASALAVLIRRVLSALNPIRGVRGQLTAAAAGVLFPGVATYLVARLLFG